MSTKIKKKYAISVFHELKDIELMSDKVVLVYDNMYATSIKRYSTIRNCNSGRCIHKEIINNQVTFSVHELKDIRTSGCFEASVSIFVLKKRLSMRTKVTQGIVDKMDELDQPECAFGIEYTEKGNIFLISKRYHYQVTDVCGIEENQFCISGYVSCLAAEEISMVELIICRRGSEDEAVFSSNLKNIENGKFSFSCDIDFLSVCKNHLVLNSRWDVFIQLRNTSGENVFRSLLTMRSYYSIKNEEERYVLNLETHQDRITSLYLTESKQNLAFWHIDKAKFEEVFNYAIGKTTYYQTLKTKPLNEKMVVFESFLGKQYTGNPKYIYEEMLKDHRFCDFKFIWSINEKHKNLIPGNVITVKRGTKEYYGYLAESKYWVNNIIFPIHHKREGNVYLQTWHGTPLKRLSFDMKIEGIDRLERDNFYAESRMWDYLIVQNEYSNQTLRRAFRFEKEMLTEGYPVNDIFYRDDINKISQNIRKKLNIPTGKKVILYAPTWRDNEMFGSWRHSFNLKFDLENMFQKFKDEYVLVLRMHHLISEALVIDKKYSNFIFDCSEYDDIQELYIISDLLITDYSSVFFDFANSRKPILFFAYDLLSYEKEIRGFYLDMKKDLPGPVVETEEELLYAIENIDIIAEQYNEKYREFYKKYCSFDDGKASKRVVDKVFTSNK